MAVAALGSGGTETKKKNCVRELSAPASLKRKSPSQLLLVSHWAEPGYTPPLYAKKAEMLVNSKWECNYQHWLSAGADHFASLNQSEVLLAR